MGVEPYLISSSLVGVVAQRLVRRICTECKVEYNVTDQERIFLKNRFVEVDKLYRGKGCGSCSNTGYRGRVAIHEVLNVDDEMRELITNGASVQQLRDSASKQGMIGLMDDGLEKVTRGITTLQEVLRETVAH